MGSLSPERRQPSGIEALQLRPIAQADAAAARQLDRGLAFELGERAGNGLDGQTEIVGNVLPRHRQVEGTLRRGAVGHLKKEARYALLGVLAAEEQHMIL